MCTASRVGVSVRRMLQQVVAELAQPSADDFAGRAARDVFLELVDLVVEVVDEVEVALGDLVDQVIDEHPDALVGSARVLRRLRVERLLARRRLRDRDELLARRDEVDLLVVDAILVGDGDGEEEDAEDVVAVRLDPRPRLVVVHVRREQRFERGRVNAPGRCLRSSSSVGSTQVDPPRCLSPRSRRSEPRPRRLRGAALERRPRRALRPARKRSASSAAIQPEPAAVTAWR